VLVETTASTPRTRALETGFLVERYHRAFDDELTRLLGWIAHSRDGRDEVIPALASVAQRLLAHTSFQERAVFPAYAADHPCTSRLHDAWAADALRLLGALDGARHAARALAASSALSSRVHHFLDEVQDHLVEEARVLHRWSDGPA